MMKRLYRFCRIPVLCCACLFALAPGGAEASEPPQNDGLLARIALLEQALNFRDEGLRLESEGNIPGAMEAYGKSAAILPGRELGAKIASFRPDLETLKERIAFLEGLLAGVKPSVTAASLPEAAPAPGDGLSGAERDADWKSYPDYEKERKAVEESLASFKEALRAGDTLKAASMVDEGRREVYSALFAHRPEAMASFAGLLDGAEMTFLSAAEEADPVSSSTLRTIEYAVDLDGFTFYIRWVKADGKWVLFDF